MLRLATLLNKRLVAVLMLGFASGLPLALVGTTLQAWFTETNMNVVAIGALSLIGLPYTLKFLWAPLMDYCRFPILGTRKVWILMMQAGLAISLLTLANLDPQHSAYLMGAISLGIAFLSASQDISITAYQVDILHPSERGLGASYYIFAYRIAMLVSGGLALIFADFLGWHLTYEIMACLMLVMMLVTIRLPRPVEADPTTDSMITTIAAAMKSLMNNRNILIVLGFILFYKFGDALALQLMTNFLLHGLGFSLTDIGIAYKSVSIVAMILGAFIGGAILTRWTLFNALLIFGIAQSLSTLFFVVLAVVGKSFAVMTFAVFAENFCSGLSTAALLAYMMSLCDYRYTATQFALLSAIASLGRVFLGPIAGLMVVHLGWPQFFLWSFILCLPGLGFLILLKNRTVGCLHAVTG